MISSYLMLDHNDQALKDMCSMILQNIFWLQSKSNTKMFECFIVSFLQFADFSPKKMMFTKLLLNKKMDDADNR